MTGVHHALEGGREGHVSGMSDGLGKGGREEGRKEGREGGRKGPYRVGCLAKCGHEAALDLFEEQKGQTALVLGIVHHA